MRIYLPKFPAKASIPLFFAVAMCLFYMCEVDLKYLFTGLLVVLYLLLFPKKLLNPKNIVFAYYFVWYGIAPIYAGRYSDIYKIYGLHMVNQAYLMCFVTYAIAMMTLEWVLHDLDIGKGRRRFLIRIKKSGILKKEKEGSSKELKLGVIAFTIIWMLFLFGFCEYINRTGGIQAWKESANDAFFSRGGAGLPYLLFTHTLMILIFFEGQRKIKNVYSLIRRVIYILVLAVSYTFIGSRSTTFLIILLLFADLVIKLDTVNRKSIIVIVSGVAVFVLGMITRLGSLMKVSVKESIAHILNYFDTFENLLILIRDYTPSIGKTFFLPLNWPLVKLGFDGFSKYYDMSVWLTNVYYPESWINGGTTQWPMEADMYLSFFFFGGIPLVILYFGIIGYIYRRAHKKGVWQFIYIIEGFYIISHLRGGFLIYWYYWLIPIYVWIVTRYGNRKDGLAEENKDFRNGIIS